MEEGSGGGREEEEEREGGKRERETNAPGYRLNNCLICPFICRGCPSLHFHRVGLRECALPFVTPPSPSLPPPSYFTRGGSDLINVFAVFGAT